MKVGDLIIWDEREHGLVTCVFSNGDVCVLFSDGEFQVNAEDCEAIDENRGLSKKRIHVERVGKTQLMDGRRRSNRNWNGHRHQDLF